MPYLFMLAACITAASALTFLLEPIAGRLLLPVLGGSPTVWSGCLVFFQCALLAGYSLAHLLTCSLSRATLALFVVALLASTLPLLGGLSPEPPADVAEMPMAWLLGWMAGTIGPAFALLCTISPLLQAVLARTPHPRAADPYFLYVASNVGSFAALIGYPVLFEPYLDLDVQVEIWRVAFLVFTAGLAATLLLVPLTPRPPATRLRASLKWRWIALAAVPSSLTVGVTAYLTADVAPIPLFWIAPLTLYLASFILAFGPLRERICAICERLFPLALIAASPLFFFGMREGLGLQLLVHLALFFLTCCLCHAKLAGERPDASLLSGFYLSLAIGGAIGGMFNTLVAPRVFDWLAEYPLAYVLALYAMPRDEERETARDILLPAALAALIFAATRFGAPAIGAAPLALLAVFGPAAIACVAFKHRRLRLALGLLALMPALRELAAPPDSRRLFAGRNFFGAKEVRVDDEGFVSMLHGHVVHGIQHGEPARRLETFSYYGAAGPTGDIFEAVSADPAQPLAVVGLGAGSLACLAAPGQPVVFFEIDELVAKLAADARYFTFLRDCPGRSSVELRDGRLGIAAQPDEGFALILLDAFSSDAVPAHLLTDEALSMYLRKLRPGGLLAFHITNHYVDLEPVLGNAARKLGLVAKVRGVGPDEKNRHFANDYLVMARDEKDLEKLRNASEWREARTDSSIPAWTDERTDILSVLHL